MSQIEENVVVLVADDEPSTLALVASHVRSRGYKVLEASDGDQAWQLAHEHLPDLVILDVMMPGMSGWEVCRKIREAVSLAHTGVIMLTGIGENLNEMTSPLYGADAYLDKPFEFPELDAKLTATLAERREGAMGRPDPDAVPRRQTEPPTAGANGMGAPVLARPPQEATKRRAAREAAEADADVEESAKPAKPARPTKRVVAEAKDVATPVATKSKSKSKSKSKPAKAAPAKKSAAKAAKAAKSAPKAAGKTKAKAPAKAKAKATPAKAKKAAPAKAKAKAAPAKAKKAAPAKAKAKAAPAKAKKAAPAKAKAKPAKVKSAPAAKAKAAPSKAQKGKAAAAPPKAKPAAEKAAPAPKATRAKKSNGAPQKTPAPGGAEAV